MLDWTDQCHGLGGTAPVSWIPGQGWFAGSEQAEESGLLPVICGPRYCLLEHIRANTYPQIIDEITTATRRQAGTARPVMQ